MQKAPSVSVRGLSLRGAALGPKVRVRKKKAPPVEPQPTVPDVVPAFIPILTVDALVKELRKSLHAQFATLDPNVPTTNLYDNCSQQAFRFFTTTNTITPEAFHHKINKLGLHASRKLCLELFNLVDQEDLGELTYATFAHRIFLPAGYFNFSKPVSPAEPPVVSSPRPTSARQARPPLEVTSPRRVPPSAASSSSSSPRGTPSRGYAHSGGSNGAPVPLIYENACLSDIEKCISRKLEEHTSRSTDRFRQAFRMFTKSEGITFHEFHRHLAGMQIHLSEAKCRELFDHFDLDHNGTIELSEFTAALFRHEENEANLFEGSQAGHGAHSFRLEDFEVEAGPALTIQEILARLRDKLEQHTSKETDRFRQAFRIFGKSSGILPHEFNAAMAKLGLKLSERQVQELFELFDFDKSGDLDLNEFVQGVMLDDSTRHWVTIKDRQKVEESRRKLYSMAVQSVQNSWSIADIERMLREKIEQRTSRSSDCFRQAFRIFGKVNGIKPDEFHAALEAIGLALDRSQSDILFQRFDQNGSGDIDLDEFIHAVLPPDYTGRQWVAAADELHREADQKRKQDAKMRPDRFMTEIEMENWGLDEIERRIRDKIQQATSKSSDTFRQAYKIFKKCNHVTIDDFRESLLALGFRLTPSQCIGLFRRYDTNNSNDIDLQEFCLRILPPDYTGDGDHWSHSEKYIKQRQQEKLEYVKRSKNGLLQLPKFDEARVRYTRGHHDRRNFADLDSNANDHEAVGDHAAAVDAPSVELIRPASPANRPTTPRARPPSASRSPHHSSQDHSQSPNQRPSSATSSRMRQLERPPTPKSPRPDVCASPVRPMSPRVAKLSSPEIGNSFQDNNNYTNRPSSPRKPSGPKEPESPRQHRRPLSPRQPCSRDACVSPRRPPTPRATPHTARQQDDRSSVDEYADVEIVEDTEDRDDDADERLATQSLRALRARRAEAAARNRSSGAKSARESTGSVSGESTTSFSSSMQRAVGGAKYTPTHSNALLLQRFMRVAAKRQAAAAAAAHPKKSATAAKPTRPRRPHTTRV